MTERADYRSLTCARGHHAAKGMDSGVGRRVEHATVKCLDCEAEEKAREAWHKAQSGHETKGGPCRACADEMFWVDEYVPVNEPSYP